MSKDIDKWVSQCVECQKSALTIKQETKPIPIEVSQPFELVGMDLIGKVEYSEHWLSKFVHIGIVAGSFFQ
uniref:Integrase zinc-binding domain-containing protein n=1 Tax=Knipowitschia caucasica TaxID=637954 RepID=A0AAV2KXX8_KNICA